MGDGLVRGSVSMCGLRAVKQRTTIPHHFRVSAWRGVPQSEQEGSRAPFSKGGMAGLYFPKGGGYDFNYGGGGCSSNL